MPRKVSEEMLNSSGAALGLSKDTGASSSSAAPRARPPSVPRGWHGISMASCRSSEACFPCIGSACVKSGTWHQVGDLCHPFFDPDCSDELHAWQHMCVPCYETPGEWRLCHNSPGHSGEGKGVAEVPWWETEEDDAT